MRWSGWRPTGNGRITTRGRVARTSSITLARDGSSFWRWASGSPTLSRTCTPSVRAARSASAARRPASPRVPVSPWVKSTMPTRWPARTAFASVPPQVSSASSRWAAIARRSTCWLFISQRLHGIEPRRPCCRGDPEHEPDRDRHDRGDRGAPHRHRGTEVEQSLQDLPGADPHDDAEDAAHQGQGRRLHEELPQDVAARRAHRLAQSDLARPARHRHHHDRHYADPANEQRDAREHEHHETERKRQAVEYAEDLV